MDHLEYIFEESPEQPTGENLYTFLTSGVESANLGTDRAQLCDMRRCDAEFLLLYLEGAGNTDEGECPRRSWVLNLVVSFQESDEREIEPTINHTTKLGSHPRSNLLLFGFRIDLDQRVRGLHGGERHRGGEVAVPGRRLHR